MDPEIERFIAVMRADWRAYPPIPTLSPIALRAAAAAVRARWTIGGPQMADTIDRTVETPTGPITIRVLRPEALGSGPAPALIYLHGGGFVMFDLNTHDRLMREYAALGGFVVVGLDYPLAPEAKYPIALDRIAAFIDWAQDHGPSIGIDPKRLAIGGDSAGANLALAVCLRKKTDGTPGVRTLLCNYGGFSHRCSDEAEARSGGPAAILNREEVEHYFRQYTGSADELDLPLVSPLYADLAGLPPIFLAVPELDILAEQSMLLKAHLEAVGVDSRMQIYPGATHSFLEAMSISALAREAIADGARWVAAHLHAVEA
jgi:acetyl esterase